MPRVTAKLKALGVPADLVAQRLRLRAAKVLGIVAAAEAAGDPRAQVLTCRCAALGDVHGMACDWVAAMGG